MKPKIALPATDKQLALLKKLNIEIPQAITKSRAWQMIRYKLSHMDGRVSLPYRMHKAHGDGDHRFVEKYSDENITRFFCRGCGIVKDLIVRVDGKQRIVNTQVIKLTKNGMRFKGRFNFYTPEMRKKMEAKKNGKR